MQGLCCCTAAFRLRYLDNVTAAGTTPPTAQDTGNAIICLLMCGNFTLFFLRLWLSLCLRASLPGNHSWDSCLFLSLPGKCLLAFSTEIKIAGKLREKVLFLRTNNDKHEKNPLISAVFDPDLGQLAVLGADHHLPGPATMFCFN